jgi:hypothetical protein
VRRVSVLTSLLLPLAGLVVVGTGSSAGAATLDVCPSGCAYSTIKDAVAAASAGDTIDVGPGTYHETGPILVSVPLTITGAGAASTIVDGGAANTRIFDLRPVRNSGVGTITLAGMTLQNAGGAYAVVVKDNQVTTETTAITLDSLVIDGSGNTGLGIYVSGGGQQDGQDRVAPAFTLSNTTISGQTGNAVQVDTWFGPVTIRDNQFAEGTGGSSALDVYNEYTATRNTYPVVIDQNSSTGRLVYVTNFNPFGAMGGWDSVTITDNTVADLSGSDTGIYVGTLSADGAPNTRIGSATIAGNSIRGDGSPGTAGVVVGGAVDQADVSGNDVVGVGTGVRAATVNGQSPQSVTVQKNRLFADRNGLTNDTTAAIDATGNWWGCQDGPTATTAAALAYCSRVVNTGMGSVDASTWVVTTVATSASTLQFGSDDQALVAGTLSRLNTGAPADLGDFFVGLPAAFAADHGSVHPAAGALGENLSAGTVYSMPSHYAKTDAVTVTLDRVTLPTGVLTGEPVRVPLTLKPAPLLNLHLNIGGGSINLGVAIGNLLGGVLLTVDALVDLFD